MKTKIKFAPLALSLILSAQAVHAQSALPTATPAFMWGVANASFQVEGQPADSDLYRKTHTPGWVKDGSNADVATDFWNRYDEDFGLAQDLGANAFRISFAWERIEPSRGVFDEAAMAHYEQIISTMRKHGIEPVVTLYHNVLPVWVSESGGVLSPTFSQDFAEYAAHAVARFSKGSTHVQYWLTLNEPTTYAENFLGDGGSILKFLKAIKAQSKAHIAAYKSMHAVTDVNPIKIGYAQDWQDFQARSRLNPLDVMARYFTDRIYDRQFLNQVNHAMPHRKPALDFLGVNYYSRSMVKFSLKEFAHTYPGNGPISDFGVEISPAGFEKVLVQAAKYKLPILVTENGVVDAKDQFRPKFLEDHIHYLLKAKNEDHVNIIGYLHWSLTDNFEWQSGLTPRYGLIKMDYDHMTKTPRESYYTYKRLIEEAKAQGN